LMDTVGQKVSLGLDPKDGVAVTEVLNELLRAPTGRLTLPNLVVGMPVLVVIRLKLPPTPAGGTLLDVRLAWDAPRDGGRRVLHAALGGLRSVPMAAWATLAEDPEVSMQVALLMIARAQKEAAGAAERGDSAGTGEWMVTARRWAQRVPSSSETTAEMAALDELQAALDTGQHQAFIKGSKFRAYSRQHNRSQPPPKPPSGQAPTQT